MDMKNSLIILLLVCSLIELIVAPPVTPEKNKEKANEDINGLEDYMEYHRYLKEVVNTLESDPDFRNKLEKAEEEDIRSGKIAEQLKFVAHHVRTKLDELKRVELQRLKELTEKKKKLEQTTDKQDSHGHLDHANPHSFEIEDLKKLIAKTTKDLAEADKRRRQEFKEYELQKEYDKQKSLNETDEEHRKKLEGEYQEKETKHKQHEKLHEPGHKAQLEEVWEEVDQMQQDFDPKMFFMLHDLDGNGMWDQDEVKALFVKELDKMYQAGAPEDDMRERIEEMERMRESVFREVDTNQNGFIEYEEFLAQTKKSDFQQDHGWQGLDEQRPYTEEELMEYIRQHEAERIRQGYPPNPAYYPNQPPMHPGQVPQFNQGPHHPGAPLNGQHPDLNTNEIYHQPVQYPPSNQHPNQQYQQPNQQYQQPNQHFQQPNQQYQQPNQQYQQPNQQYQQPNQQYQQPHQQNQQNQQQPNQQYQQPNQQYQQPNQQYQQPNQHQQPHQTAGQHNQPPNSQFQQQPIHPPNQQYQQGQHQQAQQSNGQPQGQTNQPQASQTQVNNNNPQPNLPVEQAQKTQQQDSQNKQDPHVNMV